MFIHIYSSILAWLKDHGLHTEGLFRKAGSAARQKAIRGEIEAAETFVMATSGPATDSICFCFLFVKKPRGALFIHFRSSQQLPCLRLGPL